MASPNSSMNHSFIFSLLVVLVLASVGIHLAHLPNSVNNLAIFAVAFAMAGLVVSQYMGLKIEGRLVVWLFVTPLILFAVLLFLMMPDVAQVPVEFLQVLVRH